ncbi:MAG TPA: hypothetical protein VFP44_12290 [Usitatibacter sp.]|nr:hypothetical protein [Usitatibacter sp.]
MKIKALMIAAACAFALPALAADNDKAANGATTDKAKSEAKAAAKKPAVAREKMAGEVQAPVIKKDNIDVVSDSQSFSLRSSRWVRDEDEKLR